MSSDLGARRTVLVTGASSGIGRATALACAERGDHVALLSRSADVLEQVAEECRAAGAAEAVVLVADVGEDAQVGEAVRRVVQRWGRLDAVVHSAGVAAYGDTDVLPADVFEGVVRTNLLGSAAVARHVVPVLRAQRAGVLVLVGSIIGSLAVPQMTAYATSKWGTRALARQLVLENRDLPDVHVCHLSPGGVDTPVYVQAATVTGTHGRPPFPATPPHRVARRIVRLLGAPRRDTQVGWPNHLLRVLSFLLPRLSDALLARTFAVGATDLTRCVAPTDGNVLAPRPDEEGPRGRQAGVLRGTAANVWRVVRGSR